MDEGEAHGSAADLGAEGVDLGGREPEAVKQVALYAVVAVVHGDHGRVELAHVAGGAEVLGAHLVLGDAAEHQQDRHGPAGAVASAGAVDEHGAVLAGDGAERVAQVAPVAGIRDERAWGRGRRQRVPDAGHGGQAGVGAPGRRGRAAQVHD